MIALVFIGYTLALVSLCTWLGWMLHADRDESRQLAARAWEAERAIRGRHARAHQRRLASTGELQVLYALPDRYPDLRPRDGAA